MNWYKRATRGRYPGQFQGDEHRPRDIAMQERYQENELVEGKEVITLKEKWKEGIKTKNWKPYQDYINKLKAMGHSPNRIDSMVARAGIGRI